MIEVAGPSGRAQVRGLIDSGADWSVLPLGFEAVFGYAFHDLIPQPDATQVGGSLKTWRAPAPFTASVSGLHRQFPLEPMFVERANSVLWGRLDFMATYDVMIMERLQHFALMVDPTVDFPPSS